MKILIEVLILTLAFSNTSILQYSMNDCDGLVETPNILPSG